MKRTEAEFAKRHGDMGLRFHPPLIPGGPTRPAWDVLDERYTVETSEEDAMALMEKAWAERHG